MKLTFYGAAGEVTGSCTLIETSRTRVLVDLGLHQGSEGAQKRNRRPLPFNVESLGAVVLTHAHIDHCGRLPLLTREKRPPSIYATPATCDLAEIMLRDSANVQAQDAERLNRHRQRQGRKTVRPLYSADEVEKTLPLFKSLACDASREIAPGVTLRFREAGHIIGSAIAELTIEDGREKKTVVFSGDIGPKYAPLLRDPAKLTRADAVILESTYGDREHRPMSETIDEFVETITDAHTSGGKVIIPAFAVGRTQQLIYHLGELRREGRLPETPVYIDSPMAISATDLYRRHREVFDDDAWKIIDSGDSPLRFKNLHFTRSPEESRKLNSITSGAIIISASGMCEGGRILHHLKHNLWKRQTHLIIVGYQARGTLGRRLVDGDRRVHVMGEPVAVKAKIHTIGGFSAHAGQRELFEWAEGFRKSSPTFFINHGEDRARAAMRDRLLKDMDVKIEIPRRDQSFEI